MIHSKHDEGYNFAVANILLAIKQIEIDYRQHDMRDNADVTKYIHDYIVDVFQSVVTTGE